MITNETMKLLVNWFERRAEYHDDLYYEGVYGRHIHTLNRIRLKLMLNPKEGEKIIDIGCGTGHYLVSLLQVGGRFAVGLDILKTAVRKALEKTKRITSNTEAHLVVGDALNLPFISSQFDKVLLLAVLEHIPMHDRRKRAVDGALRMLTSKGRLAIEVPKRNSSRGSYSPVQGIC